MKKYLRKLIGLGNVDNTSDHNKPVSKLQSDIFNYQREDIDRLKSTVTALKENFDTFKTEVNSKFEGIGANKGKCKHGVGNFDGGTI